MEELTTPHPAVFKAKYHGCPFDGTSFGGYWAEVPELPSITIGNYNTVEELRADLLEAISYELVEKMSMLEWEQVPETLRKEIEDYISKTTGVVGEDELLDRFSEDELRKLIKGGIDLELEYEKIHYNYPIY